MGGERSRKEESESTLTRTVSPKKRRNTIRDLNAPKKPGNAYALFVRERFTGKERAKGGHREAALCIAEAWKAIGEAERQSYKQRASADRARYMNELEKYKRSDQYKQFLEKKTKLAKSIAESDYDQDDEGEEDEPGHARASHSSRTVSDDVLVFSKEFMDINRAKESELRKLKRDICDVELEISLLNKNILQLEQRAKAFHLCQQSRENRGSRASRSPLSPSASARSLEKWRSEALKSLSTAGLLTPLGLRPDSKVEELVSKLEGAVFKGGGVATKLRKCLLPLNLTT